MVLNEFEKAREDLEKVNSDGIIDVSFWAFLVPTDRSWGLSVSNLVADRKESLIDHTIVKKQIHLDWSINQSINKSIDTWRLCARTPQTVRCCPGAKVLSAKIRRRARSGSTSNSLTSHLAKIMGGFTQSTLLNQVCDKLDVHRFAPAGKSTTHALVYFLHTLLQSLDQGNTYASCILCWFQQRILLGGPQHASSRVAAPKNRRTRSYHSLDQIFFDRSSAASKTVEGSHKERN